jgi:hypothetical protein
MLEVVDRDENRADLRDRHIGPKKQEHNAVRGAWTMVMPK